VLVQAGFRVDEALNGEVVCLAVEHSKPDIILLDLKRL
jgi:PleD family two-component response regulator